MALPSRNPVRVLLVLLLFSPLAAAQLIPAYDQLPDPNEYGACGAPAILFADTGVAMENLHFHNGTLYFTAFGDGLWRAWPNGTFEPIVAEPARPGLTPLDQGASMMGVVTIGDALFVSQGQSLLTPVDARILRFDDPGAPDFTVYAEGFDGVNGMATDPDGNLYVAHGFGQGVYKVAPDGSWQLWWDLPMANGLSAHPDGDRLVAAMSVETGGRVVAVPFSDPAAQETLFSFSALDVLSVDPTRAVLPKFLDDVVVHPDGRILASSHERLQTLMADPTDGSACVLKGDHGDAATSVRIADDFGEWDGWAFTTDNAGEIWAIDVRPASEPPAPSQPAEATPADRDEESTGAPVVVPAVAVFWLARRLTTSLR